jgi:hypothetical protein
MHVRRLLLVSVMVAAKFLDDYFLSNLNYSQIGGISCQEVQMLEHEFLKLICFNLYVDEATYETYIDKLSAFANKGELH